MALSSRIGTILSYYESENPGVKARLVQLLTAGSLKNTGNLLIYPVDQGFEHGPNRSFLINPDAFDPHYHFKLAIDAGVSAYAAPLGSLETGAATFAGQIPLILKLNSSVSLYDSKKNPSNQAITGSIDDALRLGCVGIGFTIYPGSDATLDMFEEIRFLSEKAKQAGLLVIIWAYPRGNMSKQGETAIDVIAYSAHISCLLGAHIVKVKLPSDYIEFEEDRKQFALSYVDVSAMAKRVEYVVKSCFNGRRLVIFSGGEARSTDDVLSDAKAIRDGGGNGFIIGRNCFQRPRTEALSLLSDLNKVFGA